ncbi:MAG: 30S ribosome-binding factor RbfA [Candidatus Pacebacteria bacterium]|nr:30S ribosome-binding factor RbfA [Candidatus Paceibacterota bacterium]
MASEKRAGKFVSLFTKLVSEFIARRNVGNGFATITGMEFSNDLKSAKVFVSIYPEKEEKEMLVFLGKNRGKIGKYASEKTKMRFLPKLEFVLDKGEKNRQKIEKILSAGV